MAKNQIIIDQLEMQIEFLDEDIREAEIRYQVVGQQAKALSVKLEAMREKQLHYKHAVSNLKVVDEMDNPTPAETQSDPWGEAGDT